MPVPGGSCCQPAGGVDHEPDTKTSACDCYVRTLCASGQFICCMGGSSPTQQKKASVAGAEHRALLKLLY